MDFDKETRYRKEGVRFILEIGRTMNLFHLTLATAAVYFQRFYMFHAFQEFPRYLVATCCLFLSGKAEETPKKCRDIVRTVRTLTNDEQFATFGLDPREEILVIERVLLQTIKFDLQVDHPYQSIIKFAKKLKGDDAKLHKMVQMSWTFVNDSLCTTLCLQWEPEIIAIAVMYLAAKLSKFEVKDWENRKELGHGQWWDMYVDNLETSDLEEVCHQVLDLYIQQPTPAKDAADSPPQPGMTSVTSASTSSGISAPSLRSTSTTGGQGSEPTKVSSQQQLHRKTASPNPPQPKSRPQTPPPLPPTTPSGDAANPKDPRDKPVPPRPKGQRLETESTGGSTFAGFGGFGGSVTVAINWGWNNESGAPRPGSSNNFSQMSGPSGASGMTGGNYPPSGYGIPSHGNGPPTGLPPGVYPGNQRDHPGASAMNSGGIGPPHSSHYPPPGPPPPSTAGQYNYHTSGYYPGNPPPHPPPSNYHQGSRY